jgi:DNA-binding IclR family transcriptional regulator
MSRAISKQKHLEHAKRLLLETETGLTPTVLAKVLGVDRTTAHRYLHELRAWNVGGGLYRYRPTDEDITLARLVLERTARHK